MKLQGRRLKTCIGLKSRPAIFIEYTFIRRFRELYIGLEETDISKDAEQGRFVHPAWGSIFPGKIASITHPTIYFNASSCLFRQSMGDV